MQAWYIPRDRRSLKPSWVLRAWRRNKTITGDTELTAHEPSWTFRSNSDLLERGPSMTSHTSFKCCLCQTHTHTVSPYICFHGGKRRLHQWECWASFYVATWQVSMSYANCSCAPPGLFLSGVRLVSAWHPVMFTAHTNTSGHTARCSVRILVCTFSDLCPSQSLFRPQPSFAMRLLLAPLSPLIARVFSSFFFFLLRLPPFAHPLVP